MIVIAADALHDQQHERLEPGERRSQHLLAVRRMDTKVRVDPECPLGPFRSRRAKSDEQVRLTTPDREYVPTRESEITARRHSRIITEGVQGVFRSTRACEVLLIGRTRTEIRIERATPPGYAPRLGPGLPTKPQRNSDPAETGR